MTLRSVVSALLAVALSAVVAPAQQASPRAAIIARIDSLANDFLKTSGTPAISVAVVRGADTLVMKGYGNASIDPRREATASTVYRTGSITKQFTSSAIMRLVEQGKISLDDPMSKYLPDVP